ncbi:MAG TPA: hypothetical protein VGI34_08680 [Candidatus Acidoferrales bacterium]|jgi:hypothetical protein
MRFSSKTWVVLSAFFLVFVIVPVSNAQTLNSNNATVNLNAVLSESLTVAAGPATVNFTPLAPNGTTNGDNPVTITTTWALKSTHTSVKVYAYFTSANALNDGAGDNIPTSKVTGKIDGAAVGVPFTSATPFGANGVTVFQQVLGAAGTFNSSHADTIAMTIDTTGLALPAATYTGILNVEAQAL